MSEPANGENPYSSTKQCEGSSTDNDDKLYLKQGNITVSICYMPKYYLVSTKYLQDDNNSVLAFYSSERCFNKARLMHVDVRHNVVKTSATLSPRGTHVKNL